ncbi:hypothetical protein SAMN04487995_2709 [Dyadobacter koreensis]|uniref:Uncharacterized protein n=1 Tax=Dyadobacter koreensis TaxID=408657 RepID=A0A1H6USR7_9BACT|nr:hypothetical protein [Dyadobacter koreensis]SEI95288.1 hypothetical protein SAMN04487995_2709 [Dyadobacter koreensis]
MLEFQYNDLFGSIMNDIPDKQMPDSYPNTQNPTIMPPMNPTPDIPGTDAPEVVPGTNIRPQTENEDDVPAKDGEPS